MPTMELEYDLKFEQHYAEVLAFVQKQKHASCFELMKQFHISYAETVHLMDTLEERGIVDAAEPEAKGPRPLRKQNGSPQKPVSEVRKRTRVGRG